MKSYLLLLLATLHCLTAALLQSTSMSTRGKLSVAIIGAGASGLSCAQSLSLAGHTVRLYEKSWRAGGRMSTRLGEDWVADHGAQYFTARDH